MSKANGEKLESCNRIKDGNWKLVLEEVEARKIGKEYFEDIYNIDISQESILGELRLR